MIPRTEIILPFNDCEYISFPFTTELKNLKMGEYLDVYLYSINKSYKLYDKQQVIWEAMRHEWADRIGYLWNQYSRLGSADPELTIEDPGTSWWAGNKYALWSYGSDSVTLLYTRQGEIVFEIVPRYASKKRFIPYRVFIRNYKSYMVRVIPRHIAEMWLKTVTQITDTMLEHQEAFSRSIPYEPGELELLEKMRRGEWP